MTGRFITFEGGEGAGKSTQVLRLHNRLAAVGLDVLSTREPGGTMIADAIRGLLLSGAARGLGPAGEAVLFAAARADHVQRVIRPALAAGSWVISDRFMDSTRAYQGTAGVPAAHLDRLEAEAVGGTRPDLTLLLDLAAESGLARVGSRNAAGPGGGLDRFEGDTLELHRRRREAFLAIAAAEPERVVVIDAQRSEDAVADEIRRLVAARFADAA